MASKVPLKKLASAMRLGIILAYRSGSRLQESKREVLYELLDDMAVGLTAFSINEQNKRFQEYAWLIAELCEHLDVPIPTKRKKRKSK